MNTIQTVSLSFDSEGLAIRSVWVAPVPTHVQLAKSRKMGSVGPPPPPAGNCTGELRRSRIGSEMADQTRTDWQEKGGVQAQSRAGIWAIRVRRQRIYGQTGFNICGPLTSSTRSVPHRRRLIEGTFPKNNAFTERTPVTSERR